MNLFCSTCGTSKKSALAQDWKCSYCRQGTISGCTANCSTDKGKPGTSGYQGKDSEPRMMDRWPKKGKPMDDWWCDTCEYRIFGRKNSCGKCGSSKPGTEKKVDTTSNDWWCNTCEFRIYGRKKACFKCGTLRPGLDPMHGTAVERTPVFKPPMDTSDDEQRKRRPRGGSRRGGKNDIESPQPVYMYPQHSYQAPMGYQIPNGSPYIPLMPSSYPHPVPSHQFGMMAPTLMSPLHPPFGGTYRTMPAYSPYSYQQPVYPAAPPPPHLVHVPVPTRPAPTLASKGEDKAPQADQEPEYETVTCEGNDADAKVAKIQIRARMNRSYSIAPVHPFPLSIRNSRGFHVETPIEGLEGKVFELDLSSRQVKCFKRQKDGEEMAAVMYNVIGLDGAHVTNYFGPVSEASAY